MQELLLTGSVLSGRPMWGRTVVLEVGNRSRRQLRAAGLQVLSRRHPAHRVSACAGDHMVLYFTAGPVR